MIVELKHVVNYLAETVKLEKLIKITSTQLNTDSYMLEIAVDFMVNLTKQTDTVIVTINNAL